MRRNSITTLAQCLVLGLVLAGMGCEQDKGPDYGWVTVDNYSSQTIGYLYLSPASYSSWGTDQLGSSMIYPGDSFTLTSVEVGYYDLLVEDPDHYLLADGYGLYVGPGGLTYTLTD